MATTKSRSIDEGFPLLFNVLLLCIIVGGLLLLLYKLRAHARVLEKMDSKEIIHFFEKQNLTTSNSWITQVFSEAGIYKYLDFSGKPIFSFSLQTSPGFYQVPILAKGPDGEKIKIQVDPIDSADVFRISPVKIMFFDEKGNIFSRAKEVRGTLTTCFRIEIELGNDNYEYRRSRFSQQSEILKNGKKIKPVISVLSAAATKVSYAAISKKCDADLLIVVLSLNLVDRIQSGPD